MAIDTKYGKVTTEFGTIGKDEPVVVFRARDVLLPDVLSFYLYECNERGSSKKHLDIIRETEKRVHDWQQANPYEVRVPQSASYKPKE
jgi:hypothetical protein